ncbi:putative iron transport system, ATP-binding protein [Phaeobacter inhibens]|uniref:ABC transporter ATP-binding protein n=1 Tax=Phaeobacter inhibens TaxID=221822 RepID=UPI000160E7B9|nr:ABC transporter ATP-binding protein [Phaeobacter inhibens]AFO88472.1 putative iron transport system, ATP-binding protein [Phaeobacter inhibens 2.10]AUQ65630.1 putative iron transport system, ATP-binding protein [Phaeobacter inhibens]AUR04681.1 putative iron transport system, ATP-binding protein [Phaeobacter inhibens]AXT43214.1 ABC transporter ATP-binding protein [Phaeobacter inhibens]UWR52104.1 ABC transporter ATP-binding protein [Phaeobacter inhibens]
MTAASLTVTDVSWGPGRAAPLILQPISFHLDAGRVLGVVGPNGAGKSSLLRVIYRFNQPRSGKVEVGDSDIWALPPKAAAQRVAAVLQEQPTDFALTVAEIVALGRAPYRSGFATPGARDAAIIEGMLDRLDLYSMADRAFGTLSGGERQRVMVARALAQEPSLLVLDEPTNHLDIRHQLDVLDLIRDLDVTIVTSLHDLNIAAGACDEILLMSEGRQLAFGTPHDVLSEDTVSRVFNVAARRETLTPSGQDHLTFHLPVS